MRSIIALLVVALSGLGCGEEVTTSKSGNTSTNNSTTNNSTTNNSTNNSTIIPVEGEVLLKVIKAQQVSATSFMVNIQIANGLPESIGISPSFFRLGVGGLEITNVDLEQSTCPTDALISSGATHQCLIYFNNVEAEPDRLIYVGSGDPVAATFTPDACETCGTENCVDLTSNLQNCGMCGNAIVERETCTNGVIECDFGSREVEGFCIPDEDPVELRPLLDNNQTCVDVCGDAAVCMGLIYRGACAEGDPFGGGQTYPGAGYCFSTNADFTHDATLFGCTIEAIYCTCHM